MANTKKGNLHLTVLPQFWNSVRPRDCADGTEPCPWDECPYRISNPSVPEVTCAIDVAEEGPLSQTAIAQILGVSQERVLFLEKRAIKKLRVRGLYGG